MDKKKQSHEEIEKNQTIFEEIRVRFNKWRFNMYLCAGLYVLVFIIAQWAIKNLVKGKATNWLNTNENLVVGSVAVILGICFITESIITSHLKTPLQRLSIKIEQSLIEDKQKGNLMRATQETNELFKETFKKFGILAIPAMLVGIIDEGGGIVKDMNGNIIGRVIKGKKRSEKPLFYVCYLIPLLFATWRIIQVNRELNKIEKKIMNEQRKKLSN
jgi:hypothetical protein